MANRRDPNFSDVRREGGREGGREVGREGGREGWRFDEFVLNCPPSVPPSFPPSALLPICLCLPHGHCSPSRKTVSQRGRVEHHSRGTSCLASLPPSSPPSLPPSLMPAPTPARDPSQKSLILTNPPSLLPSFPPSLRPSPPSLQIDFRQREAPLSTLLGSDRLFSQDLSAFGDSDGYARSVRLQCPMGLCALSGTSVYFPLPPSLPPCSPVPHPWKKPGTPSANPPFLPPSLPPSLPPASSALLSDTYNHKIKVLVAPSTLAINEQAEAASVSRLAGSGRRGFKDGPGKEGGRKEGRDGRREGGWLDVCAFSEYG